MRTVEEVDAVGQYARLTVTPTRCTLKLVPNDPNNDRYRGIAENINANHTFPYSVRGTFPINVEEHPNIHLTTKGKHTNLFIYSPEGELLEKKLAEMAVA